MTNNNLDKVAKFRSFFVDTRPIFLYSLGIYTFYFFLSAYFTSVVCKIGICSISFLCSYIVLCFYVSTFYIYDDRIEVRYFFRIMNRVKTHKYDKIISVRYIHEATRFGFTGIQLIFLENKRKWVLPSNSFPVCLFKNRKAILKFLGNKGLPIEILSNFERDEDILD